MYLKNFLNSVLVFLFVVFIASCDLIQRKSDSEQQIAPLARAKNNYLYPNDLVGLVKPGTSTDDSVELVNKFIDDWARKQLLISEATGKINVDEAEIERKMLDYRYSLIGYEFQQYYINQNLNTEVTEEEIQAYYEENLDNFVLKQNIIRGLRAL